MRALRWRSSAAKASLNLPRTSLPSHHSPHLSEPPLVPRLSTHHYLAQSSSRPDATLWTLHDGPPYANGPLHMGHLLNKVLKDTINRYKLLTGHRIAFTPGWDCHGLPIELKAISLLSQPPPSPPSAEGSPPAPSPAVSPSPSALELRRAAAACAREAIERQRESFKRFGVMGDWNSPYTTMDPAYEASELGVLRSMIQARRRRKGEGTRGEVGREGEGRAVGWDGVESMEEGKREELRGGKSMAGEGSRGRRVAAYVW